MNKICEILFWGSVLGSGCSDVSEIPYYKIDAGSTLDRYKIDPYNFKLSSESSASCPQSLSQKIIIENCVRDNFVTRINCIYFYEINEPSVSIEYDNINLEFLQTDYDLIDYSSSGGSGCLSRKDVVGFKVNGQDVALLSGRISYPNALSLIMPRVSISLRISLTSNCVSGVSGGCNVGGWGLEGLNYYLY